MKTLRVSPKKRLVISLGFVLAWVILASLASFLPFKDPLEQDLGQILMQPSWEHPLGTDDLGRDSLSRLVFGARVSLMGALVATGVALLIGVPLGVAAGYLGGSVDALLSRIFDAILSFPGIVLAMAVIAALGPGLLNAMIPIGLINSPIIMRITRSQVLSIKSLPYVRMARLYGQPHRWVLTRHILPNAAEPVIVQVGIIFALALLAEAALSFLGLGAQPPDPSWGSILGRGYLYFNQSPWALIGAGLAVTSAAMAMNVASDALRNLSDPKHRAAK